MVRVRFFESIDVVVRLTMWVSCHIKVSLVRLTENVYEFFWVFVWMFLELAYRSSYYEVEFFFEWKVRVRLFREYWCGSSSYYESGRFFRDYCSKRILINGSFGRDCFFGEPELEILREFDQLADLTMRMSFWMKVSSKIFLESIDVVVRLTMRMLFWTKGSSKVFFSKVFAQWECLRVFEFLYECFIKDFSRVFLSENIYYENVVLDERFV